MMWHAQSKSRVLKHAAPARGDWLHVNSTNQCGNCISLNVAASHQSSPKQRPPVTGIRNNIYSDQSGTVPADSYFFFVFFRRRTQPGRELSKLGAS
jgi:hypothetical protein